jgi:lipoprotein-anchoring transpeptidase ErfK/SrfK
MRPTWVVIGVVLAGGTVAYVKLREKATAAENASAAPAKAPELQRKEGQKPARDPAAGAAASPAPAQDAAAVQLETRATEILKDMAAARAAGQEARYAQGFEALRAEAWDASAARDFAVRAGWNEKQRAESTSGLERIRLMDRARRLLSRGVYAPSSFLPSGAPTAERDALIAAIQKINVEVMRYGPGLQGVTRPFEVPEGWAPVQVVSRERLPYGPNAVLFWNKGGNLDPRRLRAGETILLPEETLSVEVQLTWRRLGLFIGDWFVKEWTVGVGKPETPTPRGRFTVGDKEENPDWWSPNGKIPFGHPDNELGAVWIPIANDENPTSYGIHGTNKPATVGTPCSNGCVRLVDEMAKELYQWVRTGRGNGPATIVTIR